MAKMSPEQRDAFLREPRIAKLVTLYSDGRPTAVPVWFDWDGETARVFTTRASEKVRRIQADPRVALSVETGVGELEAWVTIEGDARVRDEGGLELAGKLIERYYPPERQAEVWPGWEKMADEWVLIEIEPVRIRSMG